MMRVWIASFLLCVCARDTDAQVRRALIIGINDYSATAAHNVRATGKQSESVREFIPNLEGAVNDAHSVRDLLTARYGFTDVVVLTDTQATRGGILGAIDKLTQSARSGDIIAFYYAGHGSQRRNSLSDSPTKLDQTIVPADANAGAFDIRDKELGIAFNRLLDKGVMLTLIFDSCHSGTITRSPQVFRRERWAAIDPRDAMDSSRAPVAPEQRGAIVFSAAQDFETAKEIVDGDQQAVGAFTASLLHVLRMVPHGEPAGKIFARVKASLQENGMMQEPVLRGADRDPAKPLFGATGSTRSIRTTVAALRRYGDSIVLQGGRAIGLGVGTELVGVDKTSRGMRLRITAVRGQSLSEAAITDGRGINVTAGDLFAIDKWTAPDRRPLRVWLPAPAEDDVIARVVALRQELGRSIPTLEFVDEPLLLPSDGVPLFVLRKTDEQGWQLQGPGGMRHTVGSLSASTAASTVAKEIQRLSGASGSRARLLIEVAPPREVVATLRASLAQPGRPVVAASSPEAADYLLVGRVAPQQRRAEYTWLLPNATSMSQRLSPLPARTTWVSDPSAGALADSLEEATAKLARVYGWITLESPPEGAEFPYRLGLRNQATHDVKWEGEIKKGEKYNLVLLLDSARLSERSSKRWVYLFTINGRGEGTPLHPSDGNVDNFIPFSFGPNDAWPREVAIPNGKTGNSQGALEIDVRDPCGLETLFLLSSDQAIDPSVFRFDAARERSSDHPDLAGLGLLLSRVGEDTRSPVDLMPTKWSIQRLSFLSVSGEGERNACH